MTFGAILNTVLIGPLKLVFEVLFNFAYQITSNVGVSIVLLSLAMNFLVLPLYRCADAMQEKARDREAELHDGIAHIKKTFKGDERMMMLQTYYKQNHYSPLSALSGSVSLLLEIPFFIAAYQFLSNASPLSGASLGPIKNFADPDAMIKIGSLTINFLPFAMTIINIVTSVLFLKGSPLSSKIQLYVMALFFLVFLYTSPSGLVFYWTLNNVFSLVKTIFYKLKNPRKVLRILSSVVGIALYAAVKISGVRNPVVSAKDSIEIASLVCMLVLQLPLLLHLLFKYVKLPQSKNPAKPNKKLFILGGVFISLVLGAFIPSTYIAAEPQEFITLQYYKHPNWFIVSSLCLSVGTFLVWFGVFYWLASDKGKVWFERVLWAFCAVMLVDYMFFGTNLGNISANLQYDDYLYFTLPQILLNALVVALVVAAMCFIIIKFKRVTVSVLAIAIVAIGGMSTVNFGKIIKGVNAMDKSEQTADTPTFELSKGGQNVIVIMLDRAFGAYFPYIQQEIANRDLTDGKSFLDGFTYYSNVISFGDHTNFASPALLGGYEYTPVAMNQREDKKLAEKQNEANLVMPRIFTEQNGVGQTTPWADKAFVFDPVYANYQWVSDLSIYDDYEDKIHARNIIGYFMDENQSKAVVENKYRDFFCFSLMKSMPLAVQRPMYQNGLYNRVSTNKNKYAYSEQAVHSVSTAVGVKATFMENYGNLVNLSNMTTSTDESVNRYVYMTNDITHEPMLLDEEVYDVYKTVDGEQELIWNVDNTANEAGNQARFTLSDGRTMDMETGYQMAHYHTNLFVLLKLNAWFNDLQARGLYDNTRIIIAADHGYYLDSVDALYHEAQGTSVERYFPLLLVKDFGASGTVQEDDTFMTNADVPYLATQGIIDNPTNPYTGKTISTYEKTAHPQYIMDSDDWHTQKNNGYQFLSAKWISVQDDIWNQDNWTYYSKKTVLTEYQAP